MDDTGLPDTPMTEAEFVVLPATMADQLWAGTDLDGDEQLLCRVGNPDEGDARWTSGCDRVSVTGDAEWRVTGGEGGIHVSDTRD